MTPFTRTHRFAGIRRFAHISRILARHGFGTMLDEKRGKVTAESKDRSRAFKGGFHSPRRLRLALEELGPSFIKLGQLMSTRADLFPIETIDELKKLQDNVPPVPFESVAAVIETELGRPLDRIFKSVTREPEAAASVAQVHRAELFSGESVAVKVIRPGIHKVLRDDIRLMYYFAGKIEKSLEIGRAVGATNVVAEFERTVFRELDMRIEAGHMEKFAANFEDIDEIHIPLVHWDLTAKSVLVMEYIPGVKMDRVDEIRAMGIDPGEVAMIGLRSFSRQLMEFGFFHADPHPANTIVMPDGRVGLVDFGITGYLDEEDMHQIAFLLLGYAEHDYDMIMEALVGAGFVDETETDLKRFRTDLKDVSEPFYGRSLNTISVRDVADQVMQLIYTHRLRLPRNLLLLLKTFIQTEALGKILQSDASLLDVTRPYARRLMQRGHDAQKILHNLGDEVRGFAPQARQVPRLVHELLRRTAEGKQRLTLHHDGFDRIDAKLEKGINRIIVGLVIAASTIAGALVLNAPENGLMVTVPILNLGRIPLTGLLGITGYTIATVLGIWLILSIFRSGKM
jgi:ubiquinone biosynthesis protein